MQTVNQLPQRAGIDPLHKLIDQVRDDTIAVVTEMEDQTVDKFTPQRTSELLNTAQVFAYLTVPRRASALTGLIK
jgi:hypothetical protein